MSIIGEIVFDSETYLDRLYIQFGQGMTWEQHTKFQALTRERKDYLFDLWLNKNGYV